jgi:hypothetical protein
MKAFSVEVITGEKQCQFFSRNSKLYTIPVIFWQGAQLIKLLIVYVHRICWPIYQIK